MNLEKTLSSGKNFIKNQWKKIVGIGAIALGSFIMAGCPPPVAPIPSPQDSTPNVFGRTTYVLSKEDSEAIARVTDNEIYFEGPVGYLEIDDIISSDVTGSTPDGFLRKVTDISADKKIVYTVQASLEDAVEDADFEFSAVLSPDGARTITSAGVRSLEGEVSLIDLNFNAEVDDIPIWDLNGDSDDGIDVSADARADFGLKVIVGGKIEDFSFKRFEFRTVVAESSDLTLKANILMTLLGNEQVIKEFRLPSFTIGYLPPPLPPLPVTVKPKIDIVVGAEGYVGPALVTKISQEASLNVGILYENNQWSPILEFEKDFNFTPPYFSRDMEIKAYIGAKLKMPVYGVAGPYGELLGFLRLSIDDIPSYALWDWDIYGGLEARLGAQVKAFGHTFVDFSTTLLEQEWLLNSGSGSGKPPEEPNKDSTTITIQPGSEGKDAYVWKGYYSPTNSYWSENNGGEPELFVDNYSGNKGTAIAKSFLEFNLPSIPYGSTISSAKLRLYGPQNPSFSNVPVNIKRIAQDWDEYFGDEGPSYSSTIVDSVYLTGTSQWYEWDMTSLVRDWKNGTYPNYGIVLTSGNRTQGDIFASYSFYSGDYYSDSSKRPKLEITYD